MSDKIDQRIVEMSFENQKFEKGISQSKNSLKEFANALQNSDLNKGFNGLEQSVGAVSNSFSILEQIGIGALRRLGETAMNTGMNMIKSLSVDQLSAGWTKYAQKTASVQTIMNATGKSVSQVNDYLDRLMWYSDETSYGFTDMTQALGQMTSAGGNIDKLIPMITGVATATAYAGKSATEFSRVMYNLNQSYGRGYLEFRDWSSVEQAGVGGQALKQVFIDTGKALGKLNAEGRTAQGTLVNIGTFGTTLQDKWANTAVMEAAFSKFSELSEAAYKLVKDGTYETAGEAMEFLAGKYSEVAEKGFNSAQKAKTFSEAIIATMDAVSSGWMRTYEIIFGYFDEATVNFTNLSKVLWQVFASGAKERNDMLAWLKEFGGVANIFGGLKDILIGLLNVVLPISKAIDQIFPPRTKEQWLAITKSFKSFTETLIIGEETGDKIRRTFAGLFSVIDLGIQIVKFLGSAAFDVIKIFIPLGDGVLGVTASIGDFLFNVTRAIKSTGLFQYALLAIKVGAVVLRENIIRLADSVSGFITGLWNAEDPFEYIRKTGIQIFTDLLTRIKMVTNWLSVNLTKAVQNFTGLFDWKAIGENINVLPTIVAILKDAVEFIGGKAVKGFKDFSDAVDNIDFSKIATFVVGGVLLIFFKQLSDLTGAMTSFTLSVTGAINGFTKKFVGPKTTTLVRDMAFAFGVLSASLWVLSRIPAEDLNRSFVTMAKGVAVFVTAYGLLQGIQVAASNLTKNKDMATSAFGLTGIAASLLIMSFAVKNIGQIDEARIWDATMALGALLGFMTTYQILSAYISKIPNQQKVTMNLTGMSMSILTLVGALVLLDKVSFNDLQISLAKMASILAVIGSFQLLLGATARLGGGKSASTSILGVAGGIVAMIAVLKLLAFMDPQIITQSIANLGLMVLLLAGIEIIMGAAGRLGGGKKFNTDIFGAQLGLLSLTALIVVLGAINQETIDRGIISLAKMAGILGGIQIMTAGAARLAKGEKTQKILGAVTLSILTFTASIAVLGNVPQVVIDKGFLTLTKLIGLIGAIQIMTVVAAHIGGGKSTFTSLLGITASIVALTGSLILLSMIDQVALRESIKSLAIASTAIAALGFAISQISGAMNLVSKGYSGSSGFLAKVKQFGVTLLAIGGTLLAVGALLGTTVAFFGILSFLSKDIDNISWESLTKFTAGIAIVSTLMTAMALLAKPLSLVGALGKNMFSGVLVSLGALALVVIGTAGLAQLLSLLIVDATILTRGLDLLVQVGDGIGRFIGSAMGGIAGGTLESIGGSLAAFVQLLDGFSPESLQGIKALAEAILIITQSSILTGIAGFVTGTNSMDIFAKQLTQLVKAIKVVSSTDVHIASMRLADMVPMATNLKIFAEAAKGIPNSGGFVGGFMGNNNIDTFGVMLTKFVAAFGFTTPIQVTRATEVLDAMTPMAANLKIFAEAAQGIPNSGGFMGRFLGENNIDTFGTMLSGFVETLGMVPSALAVRASETLAAMKPMADNLKLFAKAAQEIPNTGGALSAFFGTIDLATFSSQVQGLTELFGTIDQTKLANATSSLSLMSTSMLPALILFSEFTNTLKASGGLAQLFSGNTTLSEFAIDLRLFIDQLHAIDFTIVGPAMDALSRITTAFETVGATVLANAKASFDNNRKPFQTSIATILHEPIRQLEGQKNTLALTIGTIFKAVLASGDPYINDFRILGGNLISGLKFGIETGKTGAVKSIETVMNAVVEAANEVVDTGSPSRLFATIGGWCTKGLAVGISKNTNIAAKAGSNLATAVEDSIRNGLDIHSISPKLRDDVGAMVPKSLVAGWEGLKGWMNNSAEQLGIDAGTITMEGVVSAVANNTGGITTGVTGLLDILTDTTRPPAEKAGEDIGNSLTEGFGNAITNDATGIKQVVKTELDKLKALIEERQFYGTITLDEELSMLQTLRLSYIEGSEERKQIDREIYSRLKTINDAQLAYINGVAKAQSDAAEAQSKLNSDRFKASKVANADAVKAHKDLWEKYEEDVADAKADAKEKAEREEKRHADNLARIAEDAERDRISIRERYASDQMAINDRLLADIDAKNQAYEQAVKSRTSAIFGSYDLFAVVPHDVALTGTGLLTKLQDQVAAVSDWKTSLNALENRGISTALMEELQAMGPSAKSQIKALLTLTDEQLTEYDSLFETKFVLANTIAVDELEGLKTETALAIQSLNAQAANDLVGLEAAFLDSLNSIDANLQLDMDKLNTTHNEAMTVIENDLKTQLGKLVTAWKVADDKVNTNLAEDLAALDVTFNESMTTINGDLKTKLGELETAFTGTMKTITGLTEAELNALIADNRVKLTQLNLDTESKLNVVAKTYEKGGAKATTSFDTSLNNLIPNTQSTLGDLMTTVNAAFTAAIPDFETAGRNVAAGFADGIRNGTYLAIAAAEELASSAASAAKKALDERSPSKIFEGIGRFVSMGFADGISDYAYYAEKAAQEMAQGPLAAVSQVLSDMEDSEDWTFTITPVIDLSAIRPKTIPQLFTAPVHLGATSSKLAVETIQNGNRKALQQSEHATKEDLVELRNSLQPRNQKPGITQNLTINSPKALSPAETARQNRRVLQELALEY